MRRSLLLCATLLAVLVASLPLSSPAQADETPPPDPVSGVVLPPLDGLIELLPPLPVPHQPYLETTCRSGSGKCIDRVIVRMRERLRGLARRCSHSAVFSLAYLRVTENVRAAVRSGYFDDRKWLNRVDAVFAELYFDVTSAWESGRRDDIPGAWRIALEAEDERAMTGLGNFLLSMNAHINRDFPYAIAAVGLTDTGGSSHKSDHNRYNQRLDTLYAPVFAEEARRFDPTFDDYDVGTIEETLAGVIMRGWREMVWRHAEQLTLAETDAQRALAENQIETYAALQALFIRQMFASPSSARRDAWCARHGTGR